MVNPEHVLTSLKKMDELMHLLGTKENKDWMRLMNAPDFLKRELNDVFREPSPELSQKKLESLILETDELLKIAAHHKFLNNGSVRIWSTLKSIHTSLAEFAKSIHD